MYLTIHHILSFHRGLFKKILWVPWKRLTKTGSIYLSFSDYFLILTLPIQRLLSSKALGRKYFWKPSKPCHVGIHWIALAEYSQMSTHVPGFQSFFRFICITLNWLNKVIWIKDKKKFDFVIYFEIFLFSSLKFVRFSGWFMPIIWHNF